MLVKTGCIPDGTKIWWDVRPNWNYPTLEISHLRCLHTGGRGSLHCGHLPGHRSIKLWKLRRDNMTFRIYPLELIEENKWRAVRYGLSGKMIDFGKQEEFPAKDLCREMIELVCRTMWWTNWEAAKRCEYAYRILEEGTSADRQLATFQTQRQFAGRGGSVD